MEYIDFYKQQKDLHTKIYNEIIKLMKECNVTRIDFTDELDDIDCPYIIVSPDGAQSTEEVRVDSVRLHNGFLEVIDQNGYDDSCFYDVNTGSDVILCTIYDLYEQMYSYLRHCMSDTYVCLLEFSTATVRIIRLTKKEAKEAASCDDFKSYLITLEDKYSFDLSDCLYMVSDGLDIVTNNFNKSDI